MKPFPFVTRQNWCRILRIILGLSMATNGFYRIFEIGMANFGDFLAVQGFPQSFLLAWLITIFEIAGGLTLVFSYLRRELCAAFIFELLIGIVLVNSSGGWIAEELATGGAEYNTLLIVCFSLIASDD